MRCRYAKSVPFLVTLLVFSVALVLFSFAPSFVHAQGDFGVAQVDGQIALSGDSIVVIMLRVIRILLGFLGLILVVMIIYAGYTIMTSAGNEEKVERGKTIIKNAVIGTAIILFSFIIVQFAINILGGASGAIPQAQPPIPGQQVFVGGGSLGDVIKDHYPEPNQGDVYRNTKIVITFTESIDPKSLIDDANDNGIFGDCLDSGSTRLCDTLKTDVIAINRLDGKNDTAEGDVITATAQASYEANDDVHTFVFKPETLLGNEEADQWHRVIVTNDVLNTSGDSIFANRRDDSYIWEFETNTEVDLSPPFVVDVSPDPGESVEKNRALKITFNEPVDPMMVQGVLSPESSFHNIIVDMRPTEEVVAPTEEALPPFTLSEISPYVGTALAMATDDRFLYVADATSAKKIDLNDPTNVSTFFTTQKTLHTLQLHNGKLYLVVDRDIVVFDPETTEQIDVITNVVTRFPFALAFSGSYAYLSSEQNILVIDIEPASQTFGNILHTLATPIDPNTNFIFRMVIEGNKLYYIKVSQLGVLGIVDITDRTQPIMITAVSTGQAPLGLAAYGDVVYVATNGGQLKSFDVSPGSDLVPENISFNSSLYPPVAGGIGTLFFDDGLLFIGLKRAVKVFSVAVDPLHPTFKFSYPESAESILPNTQDKPSFTYSNGTVFVKYASQNIFALNMTGRNGALAPTPRLRTSVDGTWTITNGYRTVQFVSNEACGINSCGETIYCLPTLCDPADTACTVTYSVLARTASLDAPDGDSFVSAGLFDGVEDLAANAMDSAPEYADDDRSLSPGAHDFILSEGTDWKHKPPMLDEKTVQPGELSSDNYWWFFTVENRIDSEAPYIEQVSPGIDQPGVAPLTPVDIHFSKEMMSSNGASLVEYPDSGVGLGYYQRSFDHDVAGVTKTTLSLFHPARPFGMFGIDHWYFPTIPGSVKAMNQFCMYPGRGPIANAPQAGMSSPACKVSYNDDGSIESISSCVPSSFQVTSSTDTGCVSIGTGINKAQPDTATCLELLQTDTVSPTQFGTQQQ